MNTKSFQGIWLVMTAIAGSVSLIGISSAQKPHLAIAAPSPEVSTILEKHVIADNPAILTLAKHLKKVGAKMYGAYWCPYCTRQKEMFGEAAFQNIDYVECDPRGDNARPNLCKAANIKGYPSWEIKGKMYVGVQSFEELAKASGYQGSRRF